MVTIKPVFRLLIGVGLTALTLFVSTIEGAGILLGLLILLPYAVWFYLGTRGR